MDHSMHFGRDPQIELQNICSKIFGPFIVIPHSRKLPRVKKKCKEMQIVMWKPNVKSRACVMETSQSFDKEGRLADIGMPAHQFASEGVVACTSLYDAFLQPNIRSGPSFEHGIINCCKRARQQMQFWRGITSTTGIAGLSGFMTAIWRFQILSQWFWKKHFLSHEISKNSLGGNRRFLGHLFLSNSHYERCTNYRDDLRHVTWCQANNFSFINIEDIKKRLKDINPQLQDIQVPLLDI